MVKCSLLLYSLSLVNLGYVYACGSAMLFVMFTVRRAILVIDQTIPSVA